MAKAEFTLTWPTVLAISVAIGLPAVAAEDKIGAPPSAVEKSIEAPAADSAKNVQTAQFTLPQATPGAKTAAAAVPAPGVLTWEYLYGSELEVPYVKNVDLNRANPDDSLTLAPTVFGAVTYRPFAWLETRLEATASKIISVREEEVVTLPDGALQYRNTDTKASLLIDQAYFTLKPPSLPVELTVGRQNYEDIRLWLYDAALDTVHLKVRLGDLHVDGSFAREDMYDLDLIQHVPRGRATTYILYNEYRGIEDHKLGAYWIHRRDSNFIVLSGRPQWFGARATGRPTDAFNYWLDLGIVRGSDENRLPLSGHALDVGGTYRFLNLPWQPSVTFGYAHASGDDNDADTKNEQYRQTGLQSNEGRFGGVTQFKVYGEAFDPELSNIDIYTAGIAFRPAGWFFVDIIYHYYRMNQIVSDPMRGTVLTAEVNKVTGRESKDLGNAVDLVLGFRNLFGVRGFGAELRAGMFFPGQSFLIEDGGGNLLKRADKGFSALAVFFF